MTRSHTYASKLASNGFGSLYQQIYLHVAHEYADTVEELGMTRILECDDYVEFLWERKATKRSDDESIVFEFWGEIPNDSYSFDWDKSVI